MPAELAAHSKRLLELLNVCKFDKINKIRDAAMVAYNVLANIFAESDGNLQPQYHPDGDQQPVDVSQEN